MHARLLSARKQQLFSATELDTTLRVLTALADDPSRMVANMTALRQNSIAPSRVSGASVGKNFSQYAYMYVDPDPPMA